MIDFSQVKSITIPEGEVKKIEWNGLVLWQKSSIEIISGLLNYADWGSTSSEYTEGGWHDFSDDSEWESNSQMLCIYCGVGEYSEEAEWECPGNTGGADEWSAATLTLYNPENMSETYQITYNPNESDINIPASKVGWLFKGDADRSTATDDIYLDLDSWYQTTSNSVITIDGIFQGDGLSSYAYCTMTNVYEVSINGSGSGSSDNAEIVTGSFVAGPVWWGYDEETFDDTEEAGAQVPELIIYNPNSSYNTATGKFSESYTFQKANYSESDEVLSALRSEYAGWIFVGHTEFGPELDYPNLINGSWYMITEDTLAERKDWAEFDEGGKENPDVDHYVWGLTNVYEVSINNSGSAGKQINFSIYYDSEYAVTNAGSLFGTFTAIEGMTWREWCASSYNTSSLHIASESIIMGDEYYDEDIVATNNSHCIGWVEQQWNDDDEDDGWYDAGYWYDPDEPIVDGTRYNLILVDFLGDPYA